jgi:uncharacterized protein YjbI with pentapeptide repeats
MDPTVVAAWIAAGVSVLTLIGTLVAQYLGYREASRSAKKTAGEQRTQLDRTFAEQNQQLDRTLTEQRQHLDRTLDAQSQQLDRTLGEQRTRTLNERFTTAGEQLGSDKPAVRLAGVYAMAALADDWEENRQTCVDVLCAYLRMPYEPEPAHEAPVHQRLDFQAAREVRHTVIRVITAHLKKDAVTSWQGLHFDFNGVVFDGGNFSGARFSGGTANFSHAQFTGSRVYFSATEFSGGQVYFDNTRFVGEVYFTLASFSGGQVWFTSAQFSGGRVSFDNVKFSRGRVSFTNAWFTGGTVDFRFAQFHEAKVDFTNAWFTGGTVDFGAEFSGAEVDFSSAKFSGAEVDFSEAADWSTPPKFPWTDTLPSGVKLPSSTDNAS